MTFTTPFHTVQSTILDKTHNNHIPRTSTIAKFRQFLKFAKFPDVKNKASNERLSICRDSVPLPPQPQKTATIGVDDMPTSSFIQYKQSASKSEINAKVQYFSQLQNVFTQNIACRLTTHKILQPTSVHHHLTKKEYICNTKSHLYFAQRFR